MGERIQVKKNRGVVKLRVSKLGGAVFPWWVASVKDGTPEALHALPVYQADSGPGSPADLHEASLHDVGRAELPLAVSENTTERPQFRLVLFLSAPHPRIQGAPPPAHHGLGRDFFRLACAATSVASPDAATLPLANACWAALSWPLNQCLPEGITHDPVYPLRPLQQICWTGLAVGKVPVAQFKNVTLGLSSCNLRM